MTVNVELRVARPQSLSVGVDRSPTVSVASGAVEVTTDDYGQLRHKPSIEGVELVGDRAFSELGMRGSESIGFDHGEISAVELTAAQTAALLN